jgi:hypothetical protein
VLGCKYSTVGTLEGALLRKRGGLGYIMEACHSESILGTSVKAFLGCHLLLFGVYNAGCLIFLLIKVFNLLLIVGIYYLAIERLFGEGFSSLMKHGTAGASHFGTKGILL